MPPSHGRVRERRQKWEEETETVLHFNTGSPGSVHRTVILKPPHYSNANQSILTVVSCPTAAEPARARK